MDTILAVILLTLIRLAIPAGLLLWVGNRLNRRSVKIA